MWNHGDYCSPWCGTAFDVGTGALFGWHRLLCVCVLCVVVCGRVLMGLGLFHDHKRNAISGKASICDAHLELDKTEDRRANFSISLIAMPRNPPDGRFQKWDWIWISNPSHLALLCIKPLSRFKLYRVSSEWQWSPNPVQCVSMSTSHSAHISIPLR